MNRNTTIVIALCILTVSGLVHGMWAERWAPSLPLKKAAERVDLVPMEVGDWKAQAIEADRDAFFQAGAQKYWTRTYVHARKKTAMLVILMCGRAGRMSVHTPEVCYKGAGYDMASKKENVDLKSEFGDELGTFWSARFAKHTGVASDLRLYWAWNANGTWQAPSNPRWEFRGEPFLYKMYLSYDAPGLSTPSSEAVQDFLGQFVPELNKTLFEK
jgi:hypothetical protein